MIEFVATFSLHTIVQIWYVIVDDDSRSADHHFKVKRILAFLGIFLKLKPKYTQRRLDMTLFMKIYFGISSLSASSTQPCMYFPYVQVVEFWRSWRMLSIKVKKMANKIFWIYYVFIHKILFNSRMLPLNRMSFDFMYCCDNIHFELLIVEMILILFELFPFISSLYCFPLSSPLL